MLNGRSNTIVTTSAYFFVTIGHLYLQVPAYFHPGIVLNSYGLIIVVK